MTATRHKTQLITIDNRQTVLTPRDLFRTVWAVNYSVVYHFNRSPWVRDGHAPHGHVVSLPTGARPPVGAWNLILLDKTNQQDALGWHDDEQGTGIPYSEVFVKTAMDDGADVSAVACHEAFEMLVDPDIGSPWVAPNPAEGGRQYIVEVGDPCLIGTTKIPLLDGTETTLADLAASDKPTWVYSVTEDGEIKAGRAHSARRTRQNAPIVEVELDDGERVVATPDHRFLLRDGTYREAQGLRPGDSLMPLYRRTAPITETNSLEYEQVLQPSDEEWRFTHRLVQPHCPRGWVRHHRNFNNRDNAPENLELMTWADHLEFHRMSPEAKARMAERTRQRNYARTKEEQRAINAAVSAALTGRSLSPERRRLAIEALDANRHLANTPEQRAKAAINGPALLRSLWENPTWREWKIEQLCEIAPRTQSPAQAAGIARYNASERGREQRRLTGLAAVPALLAGAKAYNESERGREQHRQILTSLWEDRRDEMRQGVLWGNHLRWHVRREIEKEGCKFCEGAPANHKVRAVRAAGVADVYDLTVERYHNFALSSGVFVHNCEGNDFDVGAPEGRKVGIKTCDFAFPAWWGLKQTGTQLLSFRNSIREPFTLSPGGYISWIDAGADPANPAAWHQSFGEKRPAELPVWASRLPRIHGR